MNNTRDYFETCFGDATGWLCIAVGREPYFNAKGKYCHHEWTEHALRWPAQADRAVNGILKAAPTGDVYACPYLMRDRHRAKGNSASRALAHADVDRELDTAAVTELGGFAVASGTPGHAHVYLPLSYIVTRAQHEMLCRSLIARLGGDTGKCSDNDLLRPPGTLNHKPTLVGADPAPVGSVTL